MAEKNIAVILVRSIINIRPDVKETLTKLKLLRKNSCVIIPDTPSTRGMLRVIKDYVTWGILDEETETALKKKGDRFIPLHPPRKGYGGIKVPFARGGALGDRKEKINDLIKRMI
ncbi:MAG: uL30 family ribosomal protein [Candidatus Woesearchaeota archaeon]